MCWCADSNSYLEDLKGIVLHALIALSAVKLLSVVPLVKLNDDDDGGLIQIQFHKCIQPDTAGSHLQCDNSTGPPHC